LTAPDARIRLDKWLWQVRFFKTRSLASREVAAGHVRLNGVRTVKPAQRVSVNDILTLVQDSQVRVVRIVGLGTRRGPADEAQALYDDLTILTPQDNIPAAPKYEGKGRPTKRDRRKLDLDGPGTLE